ncbi:MAG: MBL fold metallo-hydrolase [Clostridia bacterium]|nr:MBL fold metallo-hydrolase [Clostridia bacterium]
MKYWDYYLEPTKYTDDCYHIGSKSAPCWLIKSTDGLILLDTGLPQTAYQIMLNLKLLGCDYRDIKHIIHSHGHIDHIGGTSALVQLTGAKTYIGRGDADTVKGLNQLQWTNEFGMPFEEAFEPDVLIQNGDEIVIGDKKFTFYETPGHTQGTLTIFFNVTEKGKKLIAGMFGGAGLNTMSKSYLDKYNLPYSLREDFLNSIDRIYNMIPDVHLGNHPENSNHFQKLAKANGENNPFIDGSTWQSFLDTQKANAIELFRKE